MWPARPVPSLKFGAACTRHIDRILFKLREMRGAGLVTVKYLGSEENTADIFTKICHFRRLDNALPLLPRPPSIGATAPDEPHVMVPGAASFAGLLPSCLCCLCNKLARHWSTPKTSPEGHDRRDVPGSCRARSPALHVGGRGLFMATQHGAQGTAHNIASTRHPMLRRHPMLLRLLALATAVCQHTGQGSDGNPHVRRLLPSKHTRAPARPPPTPPLHRRRTGTAGAAATMWTTRRHAACARATAASLTVIGTRRSRSPLAALSPPLPHPSGPCGAHA